MGLVVGVVGGSGGVGASTFAAVLAAVAAADGESVLVDVDVAGGGVDVLLGIEQVDGARWSDLHLAGGRLEPETLLAGLPRWGSCTAVLAADAPHLAPESVRQVVDVAARQLPVVVDLPRTSCPERAAALAACDLVVVVVRGDPTGLVAAHAVVASLPDVPVGAIVRRGDVSAPDAARLVRARLLGELPGTGAGFELHAGRLPRAARAVAAGVLEGARV